MNPRRRHLAPPGACLKWEAQQPEEERSHQPGAREPQGRRNFRTQPTSVLLAAHESAPEVTGVTYCNEVLDTMSVATSPTDSRGLKPSAGHPVPEMVPSRFSATEHGPKP